MSWTQNFLNCFVNNNANGDFVLFLLKIVLYRIRWSKGTHEFLQNTEQEKEIMWEQFRKEKKNIISS